MAKRSSTPLDEAQEALKAAQAELAVATEQCAYLSQRITGFEEAARDYRETIGSLRYDLSQIRERERQAQIELSRRNADLARAMGWIDAKMEQPPKVSDPDFQEMPF